MGARSSGGRRGRSSWRAPGSRVAAGADPRTASDRCPRCRRDRSEADGIARSREPRDQGEGPTISEPSPKRELESRLADGIRTSLWGSEQVLYVIVGLLLLAAAVLVVVGTVTELIDAINTHQNAVNTGVVVLERILLTLIVAELLHTLRFVVVRGQIVVEPFLFVGLIAVVRRILIVTAELER